MADSASSTEQTAEQEATPLELLETASEEAYQILKSGEELPEDTDPAIVLLAKQKKMTRDTQSAYTKTNQKLISEKARSSKLMQHAMEVKPVLTVAQQEELDELKYSDPDAYIEKKTAYDTVARQAKETTINQELQAQTKEEILEHRKAILKQFKDTTGIDITEDVMLNDVPPRITQELEEGKISFEEYLAKAGRFLESDKVVDKATAKPPVSKKRFTNTGGQVNITDKQEAADILQQYQDGDLEI